VCLQGEEAQHRPHARALHRRDFLFFFSFSFFRFTPFLALLCFTVLFCVVDVVLCLRVRARLVLGRMRSRHFSFFFYLLFLPSFFSSDGL
jgi:hypothetical protein